MILTRSASKLPNIISEQIGNTIPVQIDILSVVGSTHYIDFITKDHFPAGCNVVYGFDVYGRFFMSVLYTNCSFDERQSSNNVNIMTLFQRYSNDQNFFVTCGDTFVIGSDCHTWRSPNAQDNQISAFFTLVRTSTCTYTERIWKNGEYQYVTETFRLFVEPVV